MDSWKRQMDWNETRKTQRLEWLSSSIKIPDIADTYEQIRGEIRSSHLIERELFIISFHRHSSFTENSLSRLHAIITVFAGGAGAGGVSFEMTGSLIAKEQAEYSIFNPRDEMPRAKCNLSGRSRYNLVWRYELPTLLWVHGWIRQGSFELITSAHETGYKDFLLSWRQTISIAEACQERRRGSVSINYTYNSEIKWKYLLGQSPNKQFSYELDQELILCNV